MTHLTHDDTMLSHGDLPLTAFSRCDPKISQCLTVTSKALPHDDLTLSHNGLSSEALANDDLT